LEEENSAFCVRQSFEMVGLVDKIAKSYPDLIVQHKAVFFPFFNDLLKSSDRKKVVSVAKIIGDWIKAYRKEPETEEEEGLEEDRKHEEPAEALLNSPFGD